jgi:hypothetical protein
VGWVAFAGFTLVLLGTFQVAQGAAALVEEEYFAVRRSGLALDISYTWWGWTHVVVGVGLLAAGVGVLAGQTWARVVGTLVALAGAVVNLAFLAAHPLWSTVMIALAVVVIMALTVHGSEINPRD